MRTIFVAALAAAVAGCSSQPPPHAQAATDTIVATNGLVCPERVAGPPIKLATFRIRSSTTGARSADTHKAAKSSPALAASRVPLPPGSPKTPAADNAGESRATDAKNAESEGGPANNTKAIEAQVAAATARAERATAATDPPSPDKKTDNREASEKPGSATANGKDILVAVLMARPDTKSVSDLTGKTIAIDDMYSASNGTIRTALVAAGASFVELSEGQETAINRLLNDEVPAAILVLVSAEAAAGFPAIPGFRIFHIPLSKPRP